MEAIREFWYIATAAVGVLVWGVRVEGGMKANRDAIVRLEKQRAEDNARADRHRDKMDVKLDHLGEKIEQVLVLLGGKADR